MTVNELIRACTATPGNAERLVNAFLATNSVPVVHDASATFLYWGRSTSTHLVHWVFGLESRQAFQQVPGTSLWFRHVDLPVGSRVEYKIEVTLDGKRALIKDPLNKHLAFDPFGANSVCRMTGYADPEWALPTPGTAAGTMDGLTLTNTVWGDNRDVQLYLPAEYRKNKSYPLIVCHDGSDYMRYAALTTVLDNLIARHEVTPVVVALINGVNRNAEYAANPTQARFIYEDLLPAVQNATSLRDGPQNRCIMGASFGGVTSLHTAWSNPGVFGKVFTQSGSFVFTDVGKHDRTPLWDPVVEFVNAFRQDPARIQARIAQSCGVFESLIYYNRSLLPIMRKAGLQVRYNERRDGHNWINWRDGLRDGLSWLYPGRLWMTYD